MPATVSRPSPTPGKDWAAAYVGTKWVRGACGPLEFDCYGLLYFCLKTHFRTEIPKICIGFDDPAQISRMIEDGSKGPNWTQIKRPVEGCAVGLSRGTRFHHCGIFTATDGGLVLHTGKGVDCLLQGVPLMRAQGWNRIEFFIPSTWLLSPSSPTPLNR